MDRLSIQPIQWTELPKLDEALELDDSDVICMAAVRAVLERHGKLKRFAIHLAHRHWDLASNEILIERQDVRPRSQRIAVENRRDAVDARPTTWLFDKGPALNLSAAVYCMCVSDPNKTDACIRHGKSRSPGEARQREDSARSQRISEEKGQYDQGFPVAGHDPQGHGRKR